MTDVTSLLSCHYCHNGPMQRVQLQGPEVNYRWELRAHCAGRPGPRDGLICNSNPVQINIGDELPNPKLNFPSSVNLGTRNVAPVPLAGSTATSATGSVLR
jgi:hypothetical protein